MAPFDQFLHMSFRKFDKLFDSMMTIKCLAAQKVCDERTLVNCSTQNSPDPDSAAEQSDGGDGDSEPESQPPKKKEGTRNFETVRIQDHQGSQHCAEQGVG